MDSRFPACFLAIVFFWFLSADARTPRYSATDQGLKLSGIDGSNPIVYDNDWWRDVFDDYYLWAQASLGRADLRGNIVTRDMWSHPDYLYSMQQCVEDGEQALKLARDSGLKHIPDLTIGSDRALSPPDSRVIEETRPYPSPGSRLIIEEAKQASAGKPLVIVAGGPLTTIANALLIDPSIADRMVVFSLTTHNFGYNGKDGWSAYIVAKKTYLVEWAVGSFWDKNSVLKPDHFEVLPANPMCDALKQFIRTDLGQANQLGDGAPLVWMFRNSCWKGARERRAVYKHPAVVYEPGELADVLDIPKDQTDLAAMREEFFRVLADPRVYR